MNTPAYSDNRTDAEIRADSEKDKGLEAGTMRDANGVPRNMRQFPPAPIETYAQYKARVEGLVDIQILTEAQWRKETGQKTAEETILADLGIAPRPIVEVKVPLDTPVLDGTEEGTWVAQELDIANYLPKELTVPDVVLREMNSKCPVPSRMQGDIGVMPTDSTVVFETKHYTDGSSATGVAPLPDQSPGRSHDSECSACQKQQVAAEAEARHTAAHPPDNDSIKLEM